MRFSEEFEERVGRLTPRQQAAIVRMVPVLGNGGSLRSLTSGPDKVCAWLTYWRAASKAGSGSNRSPGWRHQPEFQAALALGLEEYRAGRLQAVERAAEELRAGSEEAAELARAIVRGVLGAEDGVPPVVRELLAVLLGKDTSSRDRVAAGRVLMAQGLRSAMTILDRAGVETAVQAQGGDMQREWVEALRAVGKQGDDRYGQEKVDPEGCETPRGIHGEGTGGEGVDGGVRDEGVGEPVTV